MPNRAPNTNALAGAAGVNNVLEVGLDEKGALAEVEAIGQFDDPLVILRSTDFCDGALINHPAGGRVGPTDPADIPVPGDRATHGTGHGPISGADPKVIADTFATPIEPEVNGVQDMLYMSSQSTGDGTMTLDVTRSQKFREYTTGNTSWFSHKATIRIILCDLLGIDLGRYRDRIDMLSGSVSIVKFDLHGPLLQVLGDRAYMGEKLAMRPGT